VPHLFLNTAGTHWGATPDKLPWSIGFPPVAGTQIGIGVHYVTRVKPMAKIAVLYGNDEYGREIIEAVKRNLEGSGAVVVAAETYEYNDTAVDSQIIKLASSGADVFLDYAIGRASLQALQKAHDIGWSRRRRRPQASSSSCRPRSPKGCSVPVISRIPISTSSSPTRRSNCTRRSLRNITASVST
jgi:branched-chain amino acid transport system substrate-binding protein